MKPILFNTEMVRAILEGRKSVTRRLVKPQPKSKLAYVCMGDGLRHTMNFVPAQYENILFI